MISLSRRQFLKALAFAPLTPLIETGKWLPTGTADIQSWRENLQMIFRPLFGPETTVTRDLNRLWQRWFVEHTAPSPAILEGFYTRFGPSSISRGQFKIMSSQLQQDVASGRVDILSLRRGQRNLLALREEYDRQDPDGHYDIQSAGYRDAFTRVLNTCGYDGAVAMKSPTDLGRSGTVHIWNKLTERWSPPIRVICLNTAGEDMWRNWVDQHLTFYDYDSAYNAEMGWVIEVSDEVVTRGATFFDTQNQVSAFIRFVDDDLSGSMVTFPLVERAVPALHPNNHGFAFDLHRVVRNMNPQDVHEIVLQHPAAMINLEGAWVTINQKSFIPCALYRLGLRYGVHLAYFQGVDYAALDEALDHGTLPPGQVVGVGMIHRLMGRLANNGWMTRQVLTSPEDVPKTQVGVWFVENWSGGAALLTSQGIMAQDAYGVWQCYDYDELAVPRVRSLAQVLNGEAHGSMSRVVILS